MNKAMKSICIAKVCVCAAVCALNAGAADFLVKEYGAKGDGVTFDTEAVQKAIDACAADGGGRVVLEKGVFLVKPIMLKSGVDLHIARNARLLGSGDWRDYPNSGNLKHVISENMPRARDAALITADYGQYLLSDVLENPPASVKLFYLTIAGNLAPDVRAKLDALKAARPDATFVENVTPADITAEAIAARAAQAGVHRFTAPGAANVCSAEGVVLVQALKEGPLEIDFGLCGPVRDALTGAFVCNGPRAVLPFRLGETRLFSR